MNKLPVVVCVILLCACANVRKQYDSENMLEEEWKLDSASNVDMVFEDVPVPKGFGLLDRKSNFYRSRKIRYGDLRYLGKAQITQVISFYKDQMAKYGWVAGPEELGDSGTHRLSFTKGEESCNVFLSRDGSATRVRVRLVR